MKHSKEQLAEHIKYCPNHKYKLKRVLGRDVTFVDEYPGKKFTLNVTLYRCNTSLKEYETLSRIVKIAKINYLSEQ